MGFLDKAKERIARSGEETIRTLPKTQEEKTQGPSPAPKPVKPPKAPKVKTPVRGKPHPQPREEPKPQEAAPSAVADDATKYLDLQEEEVLSEQVMESVFDLEGEPLDFSSQMTEAYQRAKATEAERFKGVPEVQAADGQVQDILSLYGIPLTYAVPAQVLMPEDLEKFQFSQQVPVGYDQGEVDAFKEQVAKSLEWCYARLEDRNEHVPRLATTIDKLQVDANNLRFQSEIAHGINIIPTSEAEELQTKLYEARITIRDLQNQLKDKADTGLSAHERGRFEQLQDEVSLLRREKAMAEEGLLALKSRVHLLEQEAELEAELPFSAPLPSPEQKLPEGPDEGAPEEVPLPDPFADAGLEAELPEVTFSTTPEAEPKYQSVFDVEADLPGIEFMDETHDAYPPMVFPQEEEDDEDRLLREWRHGK